MEKDLRDWDSFGILRVGPALPLGKIAFRRKIDATLQSLTDVKLKLKHEQQQAPPGFDRVGPVRSVSCFSFPAGCEAGSVPPYRAYWSRWALQKAPLRSRHSTASGIMRP